MSKIVKVTYNAETLETQIIVDGQPFDTSRINGKEIADWAYPFMVRKVRWNGFYDEMIAALGGEKAFDLVFEGSEEALAELKESLEDAPVNFISGDVRNIVVITYDADSLTTQITINDQPFDISRIDGKEIDDWVYPFMMRKVKWDGIFEEMRNVLGTDEYEIHFSGKRAAMKVLMEECPETVSITYLKNDKLKKTNTIQPIAKASTPIPKEVPTQNNAIKNEELLRFEAAANAGDSEAAFYLGDCYKFGKGVTQNDAVALKWYAESAELGNTDAQFEVGCCLYHGEGIQLDRLAALELYFNSAKNGNLVALEMLQFLSEQGNDYAFKLYKGLVPTAKMHMPKPKMAYQYRPSAVIPDSTEFKGYDVNDTSFASKVSKLKTTIQDPDFKDSFIYGVKFGAGALKILGTITGQPELNITASAIEKTATSVVDGDISSAFGAAKEGLNNLFNND